MLAQIRLGPGELRQLDDGPVDELIDDARHFGADVVSAIYPRAVIDLNRRHDELDPLVLADHRHAGSGQQFLTSVKAKVGLGVVPTKVMGQAIYRQPISLADVHDRVEFAYWPYYRFLRALIDERLTMFPHVLVLDCHSMPQSVAMVGREPVDVALGDRFGTTCQPELVALTQRYFRDCGLKAARNKPFAGGHITEHFGQLPHVSCIQIELRRDLFFDEATYIAHHGMSRMQSMMTGLVRQLGQAMGQDAISTAA